MPHKAFNKFFLGLFIYLTSFCCFAATLALYEQPKTDAKIIGNIDTAKGIIPIFTPPNSEWVKIGDPSNGNVGWVKSSDLMKAGTTSSGFSFSQKIVSGGKEPQSYVVQLGVPPTTLTEQQSAALLKEFEAQQAAIQKNVQHMLKNVYEDLNSSGMNYPVFIPVIVVPQQTLTPASKSSSPTNTPAEATQRNK